MGWWGGFGGSVGVEDLPGDVGTVTRDEGRGKGAGEAVRVKELPGDFGACCSPHPQTTNSLSAA